MPAEVKVEPTAPALEGEILTLPNVLSMLTGESLPVEAQQLLQDIPVLLEWQGASHPRHPVRDAMRKLGKRWDVAQYVKGKNRQPAAIAHDLQENMLKKAKTMLSGTVAKAMTQGDSNRAEASASGSALDTPASAAAVAATSCGVEDVASITSGSSAAKPARGSLDPSAAASESMSLTLCDVQSMLQGDSLPADTPQLLQDILVLQEWQRAGQPSNQVRDAMCKLGTRWDVAQKVKGKKRPPAEVAQDLDEKMLKKAKTMLRGSEKHKDLWLHTSTP